MHSPKQDSNNHQQITLFMKQTLYWPSHHGWLCHLISLLRSGSYEGQFFSTLAFILSILPCPVWTDDLKMVHSQGPCVTVPWPQPTILNPSRAASNKLATDEKCSKNCQKKTLETQHLINNYWIKHVLWVIIRYSRFSICSHGSLRLFSQMKRLRPLRR